MKTRFPIILSAALLLLAAAPSLRAQEADAGGAEAAAPDAAPYAARTTVVDATFMNPGAVEPTEVQVEFTGSDVDLGGAIVVPAADLRIPLSDMLLTADRLTFDFVEPGGSTVDCSLNRLKDGSFRGQCEAGGQASEMTIEAFE